jgi:hypothetical protein
MQAYNNAAVALERMGHVRRSHELYAEAFNRFPGMCVFADVMSSCLSHRFIGTFLCSFLFARLIHREGLGH